MIRVAFIFLLVLNVHQLQAQSSNNAKQLFRISQLEGIWQNKMYFEDIRIIKDMSSLSLINSNDKLLINRLLKIEKCGFLSKKDTAITNLKERGNPADDKFYLGNDYLFDFSSQGRQSRVDMMELENTNVFVYRRIDQLPANLIRNLLKIKQETKKDYLKEFLAMTFKEVTARKAIIFSNSFHAQNIYLIQGDEVELLERRGIWLRIRYYGMKNVEGWIKSSAVNE